MTYVITQQCCNDAACVPVCPVDCIHPTPDEPDYGTAEMLYIDPDNCIDCGACLDVCPVSAIEPDYDLPEESLPFLALNAAYFAERSADVPAPASPPVEAAPRTWSTGSGRLRVAVVGTGPAATYAVQHLLAQRGLDVTIDVFEKLLTPFGLVRHGVAPDHQATKQVNDGFGRALRNSRVRVFLGVTVGDDVTVDDLAARYHGVVHGFGAPEARRLGVPGEHLAGSWSATDFVAWYNGHPEVARIDLGHHVDRAVVIGNGNVALDVARLLAMSDTARDRTDMADRALTGMAASGLQEIRVMARRGAHVAAFTTAELLGLRESLGDRLVRSTDLGPAAPDATPLEAFKRELVASLPTVAPTGAGPVVVLDFCRTPLELVGEGRVEALRWRHSDGEPAAVEELTCGLVVSAIGSRAVPLEGLPYDGRRGIVPNVGGRVVTAHGASVVGSYVTGWAKRGPQGAIGTNRHCARETVEALLDDFASGLLSDPVTPGDIAPTLPGARTIAGWTALDAHEKSAGRAAGRPRVKVVETALQRAVIDAALADVTA